MQDGKPGFNTSPERGADTFHPFSSSTTAYITHAHNNGDNNTVIDLSPLKDAKNLMSYFVMTNENLKNVVDCSIHRQQLQYFTTSSGSLTINELDITITGNDPKIILNNKDYVFGLFVPINQKQE